MGREHLTLEKRQLIEQMLNNKQRPIEIAKAVSKHVTTIYREIKAHSVIRRTGGRGFCYNNCANRFGCTRSHLCYPCTAERKQSLCRRCSMCNFHCAMSVMVAAKHTNVHWKSAFTLPQLQTRDIALHSLKHVPGFLTQKKSFKRWTK